MAPSDSFEFVGVDIYCDNVAADDTDSGATAADADNHYYYHSYYYYCADVYFKVELIPAVYIELFLTNFQHVCAFFKYMYAR